MTAPSPRIDRDPPAARWFAAFICILYGFAKLNGAQFTILESELARPMGEVSGFWLTWHYFGYSQVYGTLLALFQIGCGVLLVVPRTTLAAALLVLPVAFNIVLIDVFYGVDLGGTLATAWLLMFVVATIAPYRQRLRAAVLLDTLPLRPGGGALASLALLIAGSAAFTYWVANCNNRSPTGIDGEWTVTAQTGTAAVPPPPAAGSYWSEYAPPVMPANDHWPAAPISCEYPPSVQWRLPWTTSRKRSTVRSGGSPRSCMNASWRESSAHYAISSIDGSVASSRGSS
jgi:hypothetical protein